MIFDPGSGLHLPAVDTEYAERVRLSSDLGLDISRPDLDAFAADLARQADVPYAMVNIFTDQQFFVGLCSPSPGDDLPAIDRSMPLEHGYCPEVFALKIARVLPDVMASPRFASNPVVDQLGVRTYVGAPLVHQPTGITLGTVCWVGPESRPRSTGRASAQLIKASRDELMALISESAFARSTSHETN